MRASSRLESRMDAGNRCEGFVWLSLALLLLIAPRSFAQDRPYIGYVYPAGGQQGTSFRVRLGGQGIEDVTGVIFAGSGVTARVAQNYRRLEFEELQLLAEQTRILRWATVSQAAKTEFLTPEVATVGGESALMSSMTGGETDGAASSDKIAPEAARALLNRIESRKLEYVPTPASMALASVVILDVTVTPDAEPGERELRLVTLRGVSNPLSFHVGQLPEHTRKPMISATLQVLGKESEALRKRFPIDDEYRVTLPCTLNGQIASGEVNHYRFLARKGQRLVMTVLGRQLVPFIADAVPGWFQPVLALYDASGKEVGYGDDFRFKPDPTLLYEVPADGEYTLGIHDSLYRGREDFVYRLTIGELPFITSIFPLGGRAGTPVSPRLNGWNLDGATLASVPPAAGRGVHWVSAQRKGQMSNRVPFALDTLPEVLEQEPNNDVTHAQSVTLPVVVNGRIERTDDWDIFRFSGRSNELVVAEVQARRLDSPLDSLLKLTDAAGRVLAFNDDHEDLSAGLNTHQADSYLVAKLPADGLYCVHIGDTARKGGEEYGYRLRLSAPIPDFELRIVPSSIGLRSNSTGTLTVYAQRKDGFEAPIALSLKDPPAGFSAAPVSLSGTQNVARLALRTRLLATPEPLALTVVGSARIGSQDVVHEAVPAEDRMQAFLWRQLVPAQDLRALVFDPGYQPAPKRVPRARPVAKVVTNASVPLKVTGTNLVAGTNSPAGTNVVAAPRFTKEQVAGRLRQLRRLYEEGMLADDFYNEKVAECEAAQ